MTPKEAYRILGLSSEAELHEIKKRYHQLMMEVHPDANLSSKARHTYHAQKINDAYAVLKKAMSGSIPASHSKEKSTDREKYSSWTAPVNTNAYMERDILHYAENHEGTVFGSFHIAKGKYLWTMEEDFSLFLLSMYRCSQKLLDEIDSTRPEKETPAIRHQIQAELAYLLSQQFIDGTSLLQKLAKEESADQEGCRIFYISSMLEPCGKAVPLKTGERLYPSKIKGHKLYVKNSSGQELGYLSFLDDRLYYAAVPLFEQKKVQVKIQAAGKQPAKAKKTAGNYNNLDLWLKLMEGDTTPMPENLNLQIELLLEQYGCSC